MKKVILVIFGSMESKELYEENFRFTGALEVLKAKFLVNKSELVLFEDSGKNLEFEACLLGFFEMLTNNSKKTEPDHVVVVSTRNRTKDELIWELIKNYFINTLFVYEKDKDFLKVEGFKKTYLEGEEVIFSSKK